MNAKRSLGWRTFCVPIIALAVSPVGAVPSEPRKSKPNWAPHTSHTLSKRTAQFLAGMQQVDKSYPGPPVPTDEPQSFSVKRVLADGALVLDDDRILRLRGLECSPEGSKALSSLLVQPFVRIALIDSGTVNTASTEADLWMIGRIRIQTRVDPTFVYISEAAVTSRWCTPKTKSDGPYARRLLAVKRLVDDLHD